MKYITCLVLMMTAATRNIAQVATDFTLVDRFATSVGYYPPDTLTDMLTKPYNTDLMKVRSIFCWIAKHIAYDVPKANGSRYVEFTYRNSADSARIRRAMVDKIVADHKGICCDYSHLFQTMCERAKIKAEYVVGYARSYREITGAERQPDHAWNAVMIDNKWYVLDVTWASGYIQGRSNIFVPKYNDYYFLTDPELMKLNHYPEDDKWLLTKKPLALDDFFNYPGVFFDQDYYGNRLRSFMPQNGHIDARMGSTLKFAFEVDDTTKGVQIVAWPCEEAHPNYTSSYADYAHPANVIPVASTQSAPEGRHRIQVTNNMDDTYVPANVRPKPAKPIDDSYTPTKNRVVRTYQVNNPIITDILVYYNNELMMAYKVKIVK